ncbi:GNAT family N-acetyltransferase [Salinigranum rubrum]|uniref:GNAT family N-acetyltransferase n=1 Tax=Salinigranum rubrum TaxID=755307 RepID=A0A2I8VP93_9EURY|nr:GNAT family N-acetyltransferase [Salinigranum rubrum]AUV83738.1 GNAT family N-acetyltransferase [Salinigranum rubrum]
MANLWRLTRNDHARRVYDALKRVGVTATRMYEYVAPAAEEVSRNPPDGVTVEAEEPHSLTRVECPALPEHRDDETVLVAREGTGSGGEVLGYLFVSPAPTIRVHPLEADLSFDGAYVRRVFVHPHARNRGVATALVARTRTLAHEWGLATVHALVALDNRPSQWTFDANGFERRRVHAYLRLFGYRRHTVSEV